MPGRNGTGPQGQGPRTGGGLGGCPATETPFSPQGGGYGRGIGRGLGRRQGRGARNGAGQGNRTR